MVGLLLLLQTSSSSSNTSSSMGCLAAGVTFGEIDGRRRISLHGGMGEWGKTDYLGD